jgi:hypothetical protein
VFELYIERGLRGFIEGKVLPLTRRGSGYNILHMPSKLA